MRVREVRTRDQGGRPNALRIVWELDTALVHFEILAQHAGTTSVYSTVTVERSKVEALLRELGVMS